MRSGYLLSAMFADLSSARSRPSGFPGYQQCSVDQTWWQRAFTQVIGPGLCASSSLHQRGERGNNALYQCEKLGILVRQPTGYRSQNRNQSARPQQQHCKVARVGAIDIPTLALPSPPPSSPLDITAPSPLSLPLTTPVGHPQYFDVGKLVLGPVRAAGMTMK